MISLFRSRFQITSKYISRSSFLKKINALPLLLSLSSVHYFFCINLIQQNQQKTLDCFFFSTLIQPDRRDIFRQMKQKEKFWKQQKMILENDVTPENLSKLKLLKLEEYAR